MIMHKVDEHLLTLLWIKFHIMSTRKFVDVRCHMVKYANGVSWYDPQGRGIIYRFDS